MNKILTLVAITVIGGMTAAHAEGAYVGLQGGMGGMHMDEDAAKNVGFKTKYSNSIAYRLSAGYLFGDQMSYGVEFGYANYGDNTDTVPGLELKHKGSYFDLLAVAKYNFNNSQSGEGAYVVGKAGVARLSQKTTGTIADKSQVFIDENKFKPEVAVGVGYNFNKNLGLDVSFHHVFADGKTSYYAPSKDLVDKKMADVNLLMVGLNYNFS